MSYEPDFDEWEVFNEPEERDGPAPVSCHYCDKRGLEWVQTAAGWELRDHRGVHHCQKLKIHKGFVVEDAE